MSEKIEKEESVYSGKKISVKRAFTLCSNGKEALREKVVRKDGIAVLALDQDQNVILERIYRYALNREILALPCGKVEDGLSPLETAKKELLEETGYLAKDWTELGKGYSAPSYSTECVYYFLAKGLVQKEQRLEDDEELKVVRMPLDEFVKEIRSGGIDDAKSELCYYKSRDLTDHL